MYEPEVDLLNDEPDRPDDTQLVRRLRAAIREKQRIIRENAPEVARLQAKIADFEWADLTRDLGIDDMRSRALRSAHEGELTVEAVRDTASELWPDLVPSNAGEIDAGDRIADAMSGQ
jgi:hypothetical protein